jgi:hypothetical protein
VRARPALSDCDEQVDLTQGGSPFFPVRINWAFKQPQGSHSSSLFYEDFVRAAAN